MSQNISFESSRLFPFFWGCSQRISLPASDIHTELNFTKSDGALSLPLEERKQMLRIAKNALWIFGPISSFLIQIHEGKAYQIIKEIIECDLRYERTRAFELDLQAVMDGRVNRYHKIKKPQKTDVHRYFSYVVSLISSIDRHGILPHSEVKRFDSRGFNNASSRANRDIRIVIGPDGKPSLFWSGHHRLAIVQLLGIETIPVRIHCVWAGIRSDP